MASGDLINLICSQNKYNYDLKQVKVNDMFMFFGLRVMHTVCSIFRNHIDFPTLFRIDMTSDFPHSISLLINPKDPYP